MADEDSDKQPLALHELSLVSLSWPGLVLELGSRDGPTVLRSDVPEFSHYREYRPYLRVDFWFSCGYCSLTEVEAAENFEVDHYNPQVGASGDVDDYSNLFWSCRTCNSWKSDWDPPDSMKSMGVRYFRADEDDPDDHFMLNGLRLEPLTSTGEFNINMLYLNSNTLIRARDLRQRLYDGNNHVKDGLRRLSKISPDDLPLSLRRVLMDKRASIKGTQDDLEIDLSELIMDCCRSQKIDDLLENGPEREAAAEVRKGYLKRLRAVAPEAWRARERKVDAQR